MSVCKEYVIDKLIAEAHSEIDIPAECGDCSALVTIPDMFGTGDSPTDYSCSSCLGDCPAAKQMVEQRMEEY